MSNEYGKHRLGHVGLIAWYVALCLSGISVSSELPAQGFNWQYSAREPTGYPTLFVGVAGSRGLFENFAELEYRQTTAAIDNCLCGVFRRGNGNMWNLGIHAEQWLESGDVAIYAGLRYEQSSSAMSYQESVERRLPGRNPYQLITEWTLQSDITHLLLDGGVKVKLYPTHVYLSAGLQAGTVLAGVSVQEERTVSPDFDPYRGTRLTEPFPRLSPVVLGGKIAAGIDIALAKGLYVSPAIYVSAPALSVAQNATWRWVQYGIQVVVVYGWLQEP